MFKFFKKNSSEAEATVWDNIDIDPVPNRGPVGKVLDWIRDVYGELVLNLISIILFAGLVSGVVIYCWKYKPETSGIMRYNISSFSKGYEFSPGLNSAIQKGVIDISDLEACVDYPSGTLLSIRGKDAEKLRIADSYTVKVTNDDHRYSDALYNELISEDKDSYTVYVISLKYEHVDRKEEGTR